MSRNEEEEVIPSAPAFCVRLTPEEMVAQAAKTTEESLKSLHIARAAGLVKPTRGTRPNHHSRDSEETASSHSDDSEDSDVTSEEEEDRKHKRKRSSRRDPLDITKIMAVQEVQPSDAKNHMVVIFKDLYSYSIELRESYKELQQKYKKLEKEADREEERRRYADMEMSNTMVKWTEAEKKVAEVQKKANDDREKLVADYKLRLSKTKDDVLCAYTLAFVSFIINIMIAWVAFGR
jgi:hypothetical protein